MNPTALRVFVYDWLLARGVPPSTSAIAAHFDTSVDDARAGHRRAEDRQDDPHAPLFRRDLDGRAVLRGADAVSRLRGEGALVGQLRVGHARGGRSSPASRCASRPRAPTAASRWSSQVDPERGPSGNGVVHFLVPARRGTTTSASPERPSHSSGRRARRSMARRRGAFSAVTCCPSSTCGGLRQSVVRATRALPTGRPRTQEMSNEVLRVGRVDWRVLASVAPAFGVHRSRNTGLIANISAPLHSTVFADAMSLISARDLTKRYPGVVALDALTLDVEPGNHRLRRRQRSRQEHVHPHPPRPPAADERHGVRARHGRAADAHGRCAGSSATCRSTTACPST